jgi:hypothetical protein
MDIPIFRAYSPARTLFEKLTIAEHFESTQQPQPAAKALSEAEIWLKVTAEAMGYTLAKKAAPDALDSFVERVNALALGVRS